MSQTRIRRLEGLARWEAKKFMARPEWPAKEPSRVQDSSSGRRIERLMPGGSMQT
jgi:hypothetical protein